MRNMKRIAAAIACLMPFSVVEAQQSPPAGYAMQFNGTTSFVQILDNTRFDFQRTCTIEAWIKPAGTSNSFAEIVGQGDGVNLNTDRAFHFVYNSAAAQIGGEFFRADGNTNYAAYCGNTSAATTQWIHICVTFDANIGIIKTYKNGILDAEINSKCDGSGAFGPFLIRNSTRPLEIGRRWVTCCGGPGLYFSGNIDELRIWNVVRSPAEIASSYATNVQTNSTGLVAYYTFDEGSGTSVLDRTGNGLNGTVNGGATWVQITAPCTAPAVTIQPVSQSACVGSSVTLTTSISGTAPTLQWRKNGVNIVGANSASLAIPSVSVTDAGSYDCVATNSCGTVTTSLAALSISTVPSITTQPIAITPDLGQNVSFSIAANGGTGVQWRKNGNNLSNNTRISGATNATLNIANVNWSDVGTYDCVVSNACGSVTSSTATLNIFTCNQVAANLGTQPLGNRVNMGQAYSAVNSGTLIFGGTVDGANALGDTWLFVNGSWSRVSTTGPGIRAITTMCELGNGRVLLFGGQAVVADVASAYGDTWEWNGTSWTRVAIVGPAPRSDHTMVYDSVRNKVVLFGGLSITGASLNDTWEWNGSVWTQVATTGPGARFGHASAFDPVSGETLVFGGWDGWFDGETWAWNGTTWRLASTTGVGPRQYPAMAFNDNVGKIMLFGGFEGGANVKNDSYYWTGTAWQPTGLTPIASHRWLHGMNFDRAIRGMVINAGRTLGQAPLSDTVVLSSRAIPTSQPQDQTLVPGGNATFNVTSSRADTIYQWKKDGVNLVNGARISGATSATLVISDLQASDGGNYTCALTNACGTNMSAAATLSCRPTVAQSPSGSATKSGRSLQLAAQIVTTGSTTYRWKKDGVNLFNSDIYSGTTTQTLTINAEDPTQSGVYTLTATNSCGTRTTNGANVTVTCLADMTGDGNVDGDDVIEFFAAWDAALPGGDINEDGSTDGDDVIALFDRWDRGC